MDPEDVSSDDKAVSQFFQLVPSSVHGDQSLSGYHFFRSGKELRDQADGWVMDAFIQTHTFTDKEYIGNRLKRNSHKKRIVRTETWK